MSELFERHRRAMGHDAPLFYDEPIELVSGDGVWLETADGRRMLDLYNNVPCVGHANERVAKAIAKQAATLNVHSRYLHETVVEYVERLVGLHHDGIESVVMACSGSEATETALIMARAVTSKKGVIVSDATYHGNTSLTSKLTRLPVGQDRDGIRSVATPDMFRPIEEGLTEAELCDRYIAQLADTIAQLEADGLGVAAMMVCSILANEGVPTAPAGWFERATKLVQAAGGLMIADEVQSGFGRSGQWWGYETNNFVPDIVCMGKPMGNGMPVSAVAASHEMVTSFRQKRRYFNTFAGSPLQAAAGMAVIEEITDRNLVASAHSVGAHMANGLRTIQQTHPKMGDVRGAGLFLGIDWVHPGTTEPDSGGAHAMVEALKDRGMLIGTDGLHNNVLKIRPPLVFEAEHADLFLAAFTEAVADAHR